MLGGVACSNDHMSASPEDVKQGDARVSEDQGDDVTPSMDVIPEPSVSRIENECVVESNVSNTVDNHEEVSVLPAPSVTNIATKGSSQQFERCDIGPNRMCNTHNCGTRTVKVTSTKWTKNTKTGIFGNKSIKVTKLICIEKNGGQEAPRNSTPTRTRLGSRNLVGRAINDYEKLESSRSFESESGQGGSNLVAK